MPARDRPNKHHYPLGGAGSRVLCAEKIASLSVLGITGLAEGRDRLMLL